MPIVYHNGALLPQAEVCLDPTDRGLLLGDGLFETVRAYAGRLFRLDAHLARLTSSAVVLGIPLPFSIGTLKAAVQETLSANGLAHAEAVIRMTLTRGPGPRGLLPPPEPRPTLLITAAPLLQTDLPPATAQLASFRRNERSPLANLKSLSSLENVLARQEAAAHGADEALLLNTIGHLAEASSANLFVVIGDVLRTPPLADGVLPGVTRAVVLDLAAELRQRAVETSLTPADLAHAAEAFLTNSLIGIRALVEVGGQVIGSGKTGPVTRQLAKAYRVRTQAAS